MKKVVLFIVCIGIGFVVFEKYHASGVVSPQPEKNTQEIIIGSQKFQVEIARTLPQITLGLGQRDSLGTDGMLFVMPARTIPTFWMKDMRFDLDFIWIDSNRVIDLTEYVSAQRGEPDAMLRLYSPRSPVTHVLEVNAGEIKRRGVRIGDTVLVKLQ